MERKKKLGEAREKRKEYWKKELPKEQRGKKLEECGEAEEARAEERATKEYLHPETERSLSLSEKVLCVVFMKNKKREKKSFPLTLSLFQQKTIIMNTTIPLEFDKATSLDKKPYNFSSSTTSGL